MDSHDSAANGSARSVEVFSPGHPDSLFARQQSLIAAAILMSSPGIPMLFQGQELMQGGSFNDWEGVNWAWADRFKGIISAYKHLTALRKNIDGISKGLTGKNISILNQDDNNKVIAYYRWKEGGPADDTVVIINFGNKGIDNYKLSFPRDGMWKIRFNSTWNGYSEDFKNAEVQDVEAVNNKAIIDIPPSSALILSQDN